ncbi:MAG: tRNA (adenosine(37)-N6)-dimethylallyltransferase MiaA, partial [Acidimicrobiia bacterium]|nr:tRNA (adenosine(37)-N6)-dimethylallyltransferase MiaA [Acidimicrobiia bacterium]
MRPPVVLLGPTAAGKSDVAMAAAEAVGGTEIVAVDAMQVYRGMDVGTAKPTAADRARVPHHCLDLVEPTAPFTVTDYRRAYDAAVGTIAGRPLLVAGTGLYLTAAVDCLDIPGEWPDVRAELDDQALDDLWERLGRIDPVAAARIEPGNRRRVVRALEVVTLTGSMPGELTSYDAHYATTYVGVDRPDLAERIETRVDRMWELGLVDEVRRLEGDGLRDGVTAS